jgi:hypothetical protein
MIFLWHWVGEGKAIKYAYFNISTDEISENNRNKVYSRQWVFPKTKDHFIYKIVCLLCTGPWKNLDEAKNPLNENDI